MTRTASNPTRILLALIAVVGALLTIPSLASAAGCPNEQVRRESNINPATRQPYDLQLPECRAYEMVSPLAKGGSNAAETSGRGLPVAADGEAVGFFSENAFGGAENYQFGTFGGANNPYLVRRTTSGWLTSPVLAPASVIPSPSPTGFIGDVSPEGFATKTSCGMAAPITNFGAGTSVVCALREPDGSWVSSPVFPNTNGELYKPSGAPVRYEGSSADLSYVIFESREGASSGAAFLPADTATGQGAALYEVSGLGGSSPELRLVNVDTNGNQIGPAEGVRLGGLGAYGEGGALPETCGPNGNSGDTSAYHAVSESGATVYFTACPSNADGGVYTLYARIDGKETVAISSPSPSQCTTCEPTAASAAFEGASADGSKAFFLTTQQLTNADTDNTLDLYEYDFDNPTGKNIIQVSGGGAGDPTPGAGANVQGVVRTSSDGSHAYFVAQSVLTTIPNALGQLAQTGADNLYAWERNTAHPEGRTRFVAGLCSNASESGSIIDPHCPASLNGRVNEEASINDTKLWGEDSHRGAQTPPDGRYLVFNTYAHLITSGPEAQLPEDEAQQVYRYDSQTGQLSRVSIGEPSFPASNNGNTPGMNATIIAPSNGANGGVGAFASVDDWGRAINTNGSTIVFSTPGQLQASDTNTSAKPSCSTEKGATGCDVYEWHECPNGTCEDGMHGEVNMLSPGNDAVTADTELGEVGMSESGSDIFLLTRAKLVGQDTDELVDVYDARVAGGFAAPPPAATYCEGDACQGSPSPPSLPLASEGSSQQTAGGNLTAPFKELPEPESKSKSRRTSKPPAKCKRGFVHKRLRGKTVCVKVSHKKAKKH
jgi:hypothetical protein